jgi:hypothetical protein
MEVLTWVKMLTTVCPPMVLYHSEIEARPLRPLKRTYAQAGM